MTIRPAHGRLDRQRIERGYADGYWRAELAYDLIAEHAAQRPHALAVIDGERRTSWSELDTLCKRLALHLIEIDLRPGDAVAVQLPNWLEYVVCLHAVQMTGAVVVQPGADWRATELEYALNVGPAKVLIIPAQFAEHDFCAMADAVRPRMQDLQHVIVARGTPPPNTLSLDAMLADPIELRNDPASLQRCRPSADDVLRIVFTSGTTGRPKPIMHTNNTSAHSSRTLIGDFGFGTHDVILSYVPLSTNYGAIMGLYLHAASGATVVMMDRFSATRALQLVEREGITFIPGTPTAFIALQNSAELPKCDLGSLRLMMSAGASFAMQAIRDLRAAIASTFIESYGMNEFGMGFWCSMDDDPDIVIGSIGQPIPGLSARVVDDKGKDVAQGESGELIIRSAGMCAGYHDRQEANEQSWDSEDWFHSGDLATIDAARNFRIVGRSKEVIIRGGANVSPREVEEALATEPRIREVSVIGIPDDYYGEVVCACIIARARQPVSSEEVQAYLNTRLAAYKIPSVVVMVEEFPLNAMGKVQKAVLLEHVLAGQS